MSIYYGPREEKVTCPYNRAHRLTKARIHTHVIKCRASHREQKLIPCDFNSTHLIPEMERQYHDLMCPDRKNIEAPLYQMLSSNEPLAKLPVATPLVEADENWDDCNMPSYDPQKYSEKANVIRNPSGMTPSERKEFAILERERLAQLSIGGPSGSANGTDSQSKIVKIPERRPIS